MLKNQTASLLLLSIFSFFRHCYYEEAQRIWKIISEGNGKTVTADFYRFELELHKKLLSFFQVGEYYYFIFNIRASAFDLISAEVTSVLGYTIDEIDIPFMLNIK